MNTAIWNHPAVIAPNNFRFKSLSNWSYNIAVGCAHACGFCYVPEVSTNRMAGKLEPFGITDPDAQWGEYVLLRRWDQKAFRASLEKAETTPLDQLAPDGNRAVMFCTTTDPYQVLPHDPDFNFRRQRETLVREALRDILDHSSLNVRILTRCPLAREDFNLMKCFGKRLLFGMSIPTLNNKLAKVYEPKAPSPSRRLDCLRAAKDAGLHVYVAIAPVYPECDAEDMTATIEAVKRLDPVTVFMEPINIRANNVARFQKLADEQGVKLRTDVFRTPESWSEYALLQLHEFDALATEAGIPQSILHIWPDASLRKRATSEYTAWIDACHQKISAWPK